MDLPSSHRGTLDHSRCRHLGFLPWIFGDEFQLLRQLRGQVKTGASRNAVTIPDDIIPIVEAWKEVSPDPSPEDAYVPDFRAGRTQRPEGATTGEELPQ